MKRVVSLACLVVIAAVVTAAPRAASAKPTVVVLGLELKDDGSGIDERSANIARLLTEALRQRAKAPNGPYALMGGSDKELVDAILFAGCSSSADKECIVKIGADMATDFLIYGSLSKQGKGYQVALTLLDIGKKQVHRTLPETIPASETGDIALTRWGKSLYSRLTGQSTKGTVVVTANVQTGQVFIEGQPKGNLVNGSAKISGLDEGQVKIRVESGGAVTDKIVDINAGEETAVDIRLQPKTDGKGGAGDGVGGPGLGDGSGTNGNGKNISIEGGVSQGRPGGIWRKVFFGSAVVAGIAGGVWGYSFAQYTFLNDPNYGNDRCGEPDANFATPPNADFRSSCKALDRTWIVGPVTIGAVALAGVAFYMGYIRPPNPAETRTQTGRRKTRSSPVTFTPVVTPDGAGATMRIDW